MSVSHGVLLLSVCVLLHVSQISMHDAPFVGFTAWKTSRQEIVNRDLITFDETLLNDGNQYDTDTNVFTCPYNGVYFITVTISGDENYGRSEVGVLKESETFLYIFNYNVYNPWNSATNSGIFRCSEGERVWVEADNTGAVNGDPDIAITTFTVFLMQQDGTGKHQSFIGSTVWKGSRQNYVMGDTIEYENILFDEGGNFLPEANSFRCPVSGIYYTTVSNYYSFCPNTMNLAVAVNEELALYFRGNLGNCISMVSNSRLLRCSEDDLVSVQGIGDGELYGDNSYTLTTFSTMLMSQEDGADSFHSTFVGFSAHTQSNQAYQSGETIIFGAVLLSEGDAYLPLRGEFICPSNGTYYIAVTCARLEEVPLMATVTRDGDSLFYLSSIIDENPGTMISNSGLVGCLPGQVISVKGTGDGAIKGDQSEIMSTFTVMMMYEY